MFIQNDKKQKGVVVILLAVFCISVSTSVASAYVASSTSYRVQNDSINVGGELSTSTSYKMEDTAGEIATGSSTSTSYTMKAGYQQMQETFLSISSPSDITLTPLTLLQNSAVGSTTWTIITDNAAGYTLTVTASSSPALVDDNTGKSFADYTEASAGVPETWSVSNAYEFGFSAIGNNVTSYGSDTESNCIDGADVPSSGLLWEGFSGATGIQIANSTSRTLPTGTDSTLCVATEQATVFAPSGSYQATTTVTALTL